MAERPIASGWAWTALALTLVFGAVLLWPVPHELIDWQPGLWLRQPWRMVTAVFVHYSALHLAANLAGGVLVSALGHAARVPVRSVVAWLVAWPLTQLGLLIQPELIHYGGLSGVLHAGVAVVAVHLLVSGPVNQRRIAAVMLAVLAAKVLHEAPWQGALQQREGWDIAVAPLAHATGAFGGAICAALAEWGHRARS
ncbi:rhombosortase [Piscinibacter terrae]|uniref:Rhombosortase n=1 Tax=Piscinibacter terrae TaxID=2496871 RepID=A0A3N7HLA1_9BURK|nr:rhombosortase [Albitalea terrae]RQP22333.1 rhombosortase [Albitalea terrae]